MSVSIELGRKGSISRLDETHCLEYNSLLLL